MIYLNLEYQDLEYLDLEWNLAILIFWISRSPMEFTNNCHCFYRYFPLMNQSVPLGVRIQRCGQINCCHFFWHCIVYHCLQERIDFFAKNASKLLDMWIILRAHEWLPSSKYEFLYPCLSDKYLFMAYKNPQAGREQAIFLKRFKGQIKVVSKA